MIRWLLAVLCMLVGGVALGANDAISVQADSNFYKGSAIVKITIRNTSRSVVFLPGCGALTFEVFDGKAYRELPPPQCAKDGETLQLKPGEEHVIEETPYVGGKESVRPIVTFGTGCQRDLPFEQSQCKGIKSSRGRYFTYDTK